MVQQRWLKKSLIRTRLVTTGTQLILFLYSTFLSVFALLEGNERSLTYEKYQIHRHHSATYCVATINLACSTGLLYYTVICNESVPLSRLEILNVADPCYLFEQFTCWSNASRVIDDILTNAEVLHTNYGDKKNHMTVYHQADISSWTAF